jgi:hypothetical protein
MIKSINFSSRVEIELAQIGSEISLNDQGKSLAVLWKLSTLHLPEDSQVVIEAFDVKSTRTKRFSVGLLGSGDGSCEIDISSFHNSESFRFRFKVSGLDLHGRSKILASLDRIRPTLPPDETSGNSMLSIEKDGSLQVPWQVRFDSGEPVLYITEIEDLYVQLRNPSSAPWFSPVTMHQVVIEIFQWICRSRDGGNSAVMKQWEDFFYSHGCSVGFFDAVSSDTDDQALDKEAELTNVLTKFSKKHMLIQELSKFSKIEEAQG